jgi:hypothetical protein
LVLELAPASIAACRHEKDTAVILGKEQARLEDEAAAAAAAAERLEGVLAAVARAHSEEGLELADLAEVYRTLRGQYREEYVMYNLAAAALAQVRFRRYTRSVSDACDASTHIKPCLLVELAWVACIGHSSQCCCRHAGTCPQPGTSPGH